MYDVYIYLFIIITYALRSWCGALHHSLYVTYVWRIHTFITYTYALRSWCGALHHSLSFYSFCASCHSAHRILCTRRVSGHRVSALGLGIGFRKRESDGCIAVHHVVLFSILCTPIILLHSVWDSRVHCIILHTTFCDYSVAYCLGFESALHHSAHHILLLFCAPHSRSFCAPLSMHALGFGP